MKGIITLIFCVGLLVSNNKNIVFININTSEITFIKSIFLNSKKRISKKINIKKFYNYYLKKARKNKLIVIKYNLLNFNYLNNLRYLE